MIFTENLIKILKKNKINFFTGVPDSILKNLSIYLEKFSKKKHIIASNEGAAISIGAGYYLSRKKMACIYLQNSGLGNAINPLISIVHKKVYSIPMLLIIGWRGSPNVKDEPQHQVKGKITQKLLKILNINFCRLKNKKDLKKLDTMIKNANKKKNVVACLIENNTLHNKKNYKKISSNHPFYIKRKDFLIEFLKLIKKKSKIISTTGFASRELIKIRNEYKLNNGKDFYMVGGMGHTSMVSLGCSLNSKNDIFCLDGDGAIIMHMGSLRNFANFGNYKLKHILLNNNSHESVGGQPTTALGINFKKLTFGLGYKKYFKIRKKIEIKPILKKFLKSKGPSFLEVIISQGTAGKLPRPNNLYKIKKNFMK